MAVAAPPCAVWRFEVSATHAARTSHASATTPKAPTVFTVEAALGGAGVVGGTPVALVTGSWVVEVTGSWVVEVTGSWVVDVIGSCVVDVVAAEGTGVEISVVVVGVVGTAVGVVGTGCSGTLYRSFMAAANFFMYPERVTSCTMFTQGFRARSRHWLRFWAAFSFASAFKRE